MTPVPLVVVALAMDCSRVKSSMPFKCDLALQNIPTSLKKTLHNATQFDNEDVI
jgi:hypothetical protein